MARITVEDCLEKVDNRFKLIVVASKRARQIALGAEPLVDWENDKSTVVALREIADGLITEEYLQETPFSTSEELFVQELEEVDAAAVLHAEIGQELSRQQMVTDEKSTQMPDAPEQNGKPRPSF